MYSFKEVIKKSLSKEKKEWEKIDFLTFYIERPLSFPITWLFVNIGISANFTSFLSIIFAVSSAFLTFFCCYSKTLLIISWFLLFAWAILDCVDGNIARLKQGVSKNGDLWDATAGYFALSSLLLNASIIAENESSLLSLSFLPNNFYLFIGCVGIIASLVPRIVMHKKEANDSTPNKMFSHRDSKSIFNYFIRNLFSITGFVLFLFLFAIIFDFCNIFCITYSILYFLVCLFSLYKLLAK